MFRHTSCFQGGSRFDIIYAHEVKKKKMNYLYKSENQRKTIEAAIIHILCSLSYSTMLPVMISKYSYDMKGKRSLMECKEFWNY